VGCDCCGASGWAELFAENGIRLGQCPECDLLSIADIPPSGIRMTEIEEGHYAGAKQVLGAHKQAGAERVLERRFQEYVDLAGRFVPAGRWLDIGCGAGLLLTLAQRAGYTGEGIELTAARRQVATELTGMTIHGAPVEALNLPDKSFDVISLINVFSHLTSPTRTFQELHRILAPGGVLIVATGEMTAGVRKSHMHNWNLGDHLFFLGDRTMDRYAEKAGFDVAHHDRWWLPEHMYTKDWLRARGRSPLKNAVKSAILHMPGAFPIFRAAMLRRQRDSAAHAGLFALVPSGSSDEVRR
jgi:SAM-dependent methyltransferase